MRCKTCHYSLVNLTEHRCPECGNPFDPNDLSTFLVGSRFQWSTLVWILFAITVGLLPWLFIYFAAHRLFND